MPTERDKARAWDRDREPAGDRQVHSWSGPIPTASERNNNKILPDYTRVEVHTIKPEFMQWRIDYVTPEGLVLLGDVMW